MPLRPARGAARCHVHRAAGTIFALFAPNGAGKTTTLQGLAVLLAVTSTLQALLVPASLTFGRPSFVIDVTSALMMSLLLMPAVVGVVRYQYWRRSWWRGTALAVVSLIVLSS